VGHPLPDFSQLSPELSRDVRGLRVWLPLHLHGVDAFRAALDEKLDLALQAYDALVAEPAIEVLGRPDLSIVAFRVRGGDDDANRRLLDAVNATRRVLLSSTTVDGRLTLRLCVLSHRTHTARLREALAIITAAARRLDLRQDDGRS
jgi:aromatic-L-amino-acid decarboxylase